MISVSLPLGLFWFFFSSVPLAAVLVQTNEENRKQWNEQKD